MGAAHTENGGTVTSPTQRTLAFLRRNGWQAAVVEKRIQIPGSPHGKLIDVWAWADVLACRENPPEIALVQTTTGSNAAFRRRKMLGKLTEADIAAMNEKERARVAKIPDTVRSWIRAGGVAMLVTWSKLGGKGNRKLWTERVETFALQRLP